MIDNKFIIKDLSDTLGIKLSKARVLKLEEKYLSRDLPIDTLRELVSEEYNEVGPQGLSVTLRLTETEYKQYKELMEIHRDATNKSPKKQIFKSGLRLALKNNYELPGEPGRLFKVTVNLDFELLILIKNAIAHYSVGYTEVSPQMVLRIALSSYASESFL